MGSIFAPAAGARPRSRRPRRRGRRWSPTAASGLEALGSAPRRSASAPSARGCRRRCSRACDVEVTIPLRAGGAESLNVAAAAAIALRADIVARHAGGRPMLERIEEIRSEAEAAIGAAGGDRRARGAAGPLPRPQGRADRRSCAGSPSCPPEERGPVGRPRQRGPPGARGAARARAARARRDRAGGAARRGPDRRHAARARRRVRSATCT